MDAKWKTETHDMISVASLFYKLKSTLEHTAHSNINFGGQLSWVAPWWEVRKGTSDPRELHHLMERLGEASSTAIQPGPALQEDMYREVENWESLNAEGERDSERKRPCVLSVCADIPGEA